jgi:hypothetical protein
LIVIPLSFGMGCFFALAVAPVSQELESQALTRQRPEMRRRACGGTRKMLRAPSRSLVRRLDRNPPRKSRGRPPPFHALANISLRLDTTLSPRRWSFRGRSTANQGQVTSTFPFAEGSRR